MSALPSRSAADANDAELLKMARLLRCPKCQALGWCLNSSGSYAARLHKRRLDPIRTAFAMGYTQGYAAGRRARS